MSENQAPAKKPDMLPKVKGYLQIAVFITVLIAFFISFLTNWLIPHWPWIWPTFGVLFNAAAYALPVYLWRRNHGFILGPWTQQMSLLSARQRRVAVNVFLRKRRRVQ